VIDAASVTYAAEIKSSALGHFLLGYAFDPAEGHVVFPAWTWPSNNVRAFVDYC
jgi:hypothetical protein